MRKKCSIRLRRLTLWRHRHRHPDGEGRLLRHGQQPVCGGGDVPRDRTSGEPHHVLEAYTFFRPTGEGDYRVVVDSACGIHIDELLEYTRIHLNDVRSVQFYTRDQDVGAFPSFTKSELFRPRYYFEDLPAHLMPVYDKKGRITGEPGGARVLYFKKERDE